jgi:hypothetical protein
MVVWCRDKEGGLKRATRKVTRQGGYFLRSTVLGHPHIDAPILKENSMTESKSLQSFATHGARVIGICQ